MNFFLIMVLAFCLRDIPGVFRGLPLLTYIHEFGHVAWYSFSGVEAHILNCYTTRSYGVTIAGIYGGYGTEIIFWGIMALSRWWWLRAFSLGVLINCWLVALASTDFYKLYEMGHAKAGLWMQIYWFIGVGLIVLFLLLREKRLKNKKKEPPLYVLRSDQ